MVNGQSAIWRDGSEDFVSDKIEFNVGAVVNSGGYITTTRFNMTSAVAVKENPGNQVDPLEDTGFSGLTVTITGSIEDPTGNGDTVAHRLKRWLLEPKTTVGSFPKGRFGLRLNDFEVFNLTPGSSRGYILSDLDFTRVGETNGKIEFIATLRFNGSVGSLTGGEYKW